VYNVLYLPHVLHIGWAAGGEGVGVGILVAGVSIVGHLVVLGMRDDA
jgi:hypothetical protein